MPGLVSLKLSDAGHRADRSHRKKGETRHLQPELVEHLSE
jgi:hypothetical protein